MRIAALQMNSGSDKSSNLAQAHELILHAIERKVDLVALPEMFSLMPEDSKQLLAGAEALKGPTVETLQEWAAEYDLWILGGSIPLKAQGDPKRITNTSLLITPDGDISARYDKIHLFDVALSKDRAYRESKNVKAGKKVVIAKLPNEFKAGLSICYDIRFPELYRKQASLGAEILFIPSAFTAYTGQAHWDVLTRARAIENQCYVIASAQFGTHPDGRATYGHTRIVDPWGRVIAERPAGTGVVWADLNPGELERIRRELPALQHRIL